MGPGAGAQPVGQFDRPGDAGREADAIVGARDVIVHGLRDGDHLDPLFVQPLTVTERIVATDRDEEVQTEEVDVFQYLWRDVVDRLLVNVLQVGRDVGDRQVARTGSRGMQKSTARASCAVDNFLGQFLYAAAVVGMRVGNQVDQSGPAAPDAENPVSFS